MVIDSFKNFLDKHANNAHLSAGQGTCCCLLSVMHDTYLMHSSYLKCLNVYKKRMFHTCGFYLEQSFMTNIHTLAQTHPCLHATVHNFLSFINNKKKEIELNFTKIRISILASANFLCPHQWNLPHIIRTTALMVSIFTCNLSA